MHVVNVGPVEAKLRDNWKAAKARLNPVVQLQVVEQTTPPAVVLVQNPWDIFGPRLETTEDKAFGPIIYRKLKERDRPKVDAIVRAVCQVCQISRNDILSARRPRNIVRPRQVAMYLAKTLTLKSLPEIGRWLGGRDHTTVLHAVRKIEALRKEDQGLNDTIVRIEQMFVASHQTEDATCQTASNG